MKRETKKLTFFLTVNTSSQSVSNSYLEEKGDVVKNPLPFPPINERVMTYEESISLKIWANVVIQSNKFFEHNKINDDLIDFINEGFNEENINKTEKVA